MEKTGLDHTSTMVYETDTGGKVKGLEQVAVLYRYRKISSDFPMRLIGVGYKVFAIKTWHLLKLNHR